MTYPRHVDDLIRYLEGLCPIESSTSALNSAGQQHVQFVVGGVCPETVEAQICEVIAAFAACQMQDGAKWCWRVKPEFDVVKDAVDHDAMANGRPLSECTSLLSVPFSRAYARGSVIGGRALSPADRESFARLGVYFSDASLRRLAAINLLAA